ncbi:MAG: hypothetical protein JWN67_2387, partial [Actinomycetia bacterium]|nr:hypothetical protein [Actinomycetes bacterium]
MRNFPRLATIGLSVIATGALLAGTAAAQTKANADAYGGTANSDALTIKLFGQTITTSAAHAELHPNLAKASATQAIVPQVPLPVGNVAEAQTSTVGDTKTAKPAACTGSELTAVPGVQRLDVTCGSATATLTADGGTARGLGAQVVLEPSVSDLLSTLQLQQPLQDGSGQVLDALNPLVQGLTGTPIGKLVDATDKTVGDVLNKVLTLKSTARIVIAPALAEVTSAGDTVTAHARSQGIRIELLAADATNATNNLLPSDLGANEPLITITIGNAEATKVISKSGATKGTADSSAPLVTVEFGTNALVTALGLPSNKIEVGGGQSFCVPGLVGTPLETCVAVASAGVDANGNPTAGSTSVELFKGVNGGIDLATGRAATAGQAAPAAGAAAPAAPA